MEVTIREFNRNFYKYIKESRDIVVTKQGKRLFVVTFCCNNAPNVVTNVDNVVTSKQEVITNLRKIQEEIISKPITPVKVQWCEACLKIRQRVPAVEKCEIINGDGMIEEHWLCDTHKGKLCSS